MDLNESNTEGTLIQRKVTEEEQRHNLYRACRTQNYCKLKFSGISYSKVNFKKVNYTRHMLKTVIYRAYLFEIVALNISNLIIYLPNACTLIVKFLYRSDNGLVIWFQDISSASCSPACLNESMFDVY